MKPYSKTLAPMAVTLAVLGFAGHVNAAEVVVPQCPQKLTVRQENQSTVGDGWKVADAAPPNALEYIAIAAGEYPVKQTGFNIPAGEKKGDRGDVIVYYETGPALGDIHDYWAVCGYHATSIVLVQKIPENAKHCEVTYRNDVTAPDRVTIKCFDTPRKLK
ncbi:MAG: hypothetical protein LBI92_00320 [Azoarcus sp.]|jgi:hypothetical protein|nr:hypothetical protein [Azoarcus sp.]